MIVWAKSSFANTTEMYEWWYIHTRSFVTLWCLRHDIGGFLRPVGSRGSHSVLQVQAYSNLDLPPSSPKHRMSCTCMLWAPTLSCGILSGFAIDQIGSYGLPRDVWTLPGLLDTAIPSSLGWSRPTQLIPHPHRPLTRHEPTLHAYIPSRLDKKARHTQGQETL